MELPVYNISQSSAKVCQIIIEEDIFDRLKTDFKGIGRFYIDPKKPNPDVFTYVDKGKKRFLKFLVLGIYDDNTFDHSMVFHKNKNRYDFTQSNLKMVMKDKSKSKKNK